MPHLSSHYLQVQYLVYVVYLKWEMETVAFGDYHSYRALYMDYYIPMLEIPHPIIYATILHCGKIRNAMNIELATKINFNDH